MQKLLSAILLGCLFIACSSAISAAATDRTLNQKALALLNQAKIREAIALWEKIPEKERSAEILNNLGYAYTRRSKQYLDGAAGQQSYYNEDFRQAMAYLVKAKKMAPKRWNVYLNLGDLNFSYGLLGPARKNYETLLQLNPDYKYAEKITKTIKLINRELQLANKNGFEPFIVEIHPASPLYIFRIYRDPERIDVLTEKEDTVVQSLQAEQDIDISNTLLAADLNFDGYKDIAVLEFTGSGHNYGYCYWLFNKNSGRFEQNFKDHATQSYELTGLYIDYAAKRIQSSWSGSDHQTTTYHEYRNNRLVEVEEIEVQYRRNENRDDLGYREVRKKNVKGKMVVISDKVISDPEYTESMATRKARKKVPGQRDVILPNFGHLPNTNTMTKP
jgi:tetratricopeptide (TPR) repeat protein